MAKKFTEKQREIVARKLGYKGPMSEFYKFVQSDPAMESKVRQLAVKLVAKGGYIQKFAVGGTPTDQIESLYTSILGRASDPGGKAFYEGQLASGVPLSQIQAEMAASSEAQQRASAPASNVQTITLGGAGTPTNLTVTGGTSGASTPQLQPVSGPIHTVEKPTTKPATTTTTPTTTTPVTRPTVDDVTAQKVEYAANQTLATAEANAKAAEASALAASITAAAEAAARKAAEVKAEQTQAAVRTELAGLKPAEGTVSERAQVTAAEMRPEDTAIRKLEAEQGVATQITGAPTRELMAGEVIEKPAVDRTAVEAALAKNEAAQGVITEDMTVQGQLAKLTAGFESSNPPEWAASSLRNATSVLAQRGLGASSLAGQAIIQATLEAAVPIAAADAAAYREMGLANLSNRQQMAVITAQQRAAFLGQEFDQEFQRRVINAATISDIANMNFSAKQQIAIENARLTETMNLANLSNKQALVMAEAAQIATLETANLNNRQQAAVFNAQAFLQMDMANLSNAQQTALFKSQAMIQSIMGDAAAENAMRQFNAESTNQLNTFYDGLNARIREFNAAQANSMSQFSSEQANSISMFNAAAQNNRDQFNADFRRIIDQSNAEWRRTIALADTAAVNRANEINAAANLGLTTIEYNNLWQKYRDEIEYAWKTGENALDRESELARQILAKNATIEAAKYTVKAEAYKALGALGVSIFDKAGGTSAVAELLKAGGSAASKTIGASVDALKNIFKTDQYVQIDNPATAPGQEGYGWNYFWDGKNAVTVSPDNQYYFNGDLVYDKGVFDLGGTLGEEGFTYY